MPQYRLFFRGDNRGKSDIFQNGFEARDLSTPMPVQYESDEIYSDVNTDTGVCVTFDMEAVPIFPRNQVVNISIYMVGVDIGGNDALQAHSNQITSHAKQFWSINGQPPVNPNPEPPPIYWYAREFAVKRILPQQVVGVINIERHFEDGAPKHFKILSYEYNTLCTAAVPYRNIIDNYLIHMMGKGLIAISQIQDGFYSKSLNRHLTEAELGERFC